mmetsp:Transcript_11843/g.30033  ORF Transcript_11843/g.30033 Transcript_11843/m.30033 type:complete len:195 (+) Transcript_11843:66-650(+)
MDSLLTGYGSDSDESTSSAAVKSGDNQVGSISNLLGDGIDSCSSDDEEEEVRKRSHPSSSSSNGKDSDEQMSKKQKVDENEKCFLERNGLPSPRTGQTTSMISWTTDYVSSEEPPRSETKDPRKFQRFEKLAALHDNKQGWAAHLRNQNEFHNPHFIQSVIEQFGMAKSLGSQAVRNSTKVKLSRFHETNCGGN